jgi:uncharacterized membrane protein YfcA
VTFALIALAFLVAAVLQGAVGLGYALVVAPILSATRPELVPATVIVVGIVLSLLMVRREHTAADLRGMRWLVVGLLPGTLVGTALLAVASTRTLQLLVAVAVLAAVVATLIRPVMNAGRGTLMGAGIVAGIFGTTSSIAGPPVAIVYADRPGATLRATLSVFFVVSGALSLAGAWAAGAVPGRALAWSVALVPPTIVGFLLSRPLARRVDGAAVRASVLVVSTVAAVVLLARAL